MTLTADLTGRIAGKFTIPPKVPVGSKLVEFQSAASVPARTTFVGRGQITIRELTFRKRRWWKWFLPHGAPCLVDPLAQTFVLTEIGQVSGVDLWFTALGPSNVLLHIREASQGIPTTNVLVECVLTPAEISLNAWTRFSFPPITLDPNTEYALVIMCNDPVSALATAGLGEFDVALQKYVTSQAYQVGVLLSSSNNLTWTAHQTKDLAFRLLSPNYTVDNQTRTLVMDPVSVVDVDQIIIMAAVERPTEDCDVVFTVTAGGKTYQIAESQPLQLASRYTGDIEWSAVLTGAANASPVLHQQVQMLAGTRLATGDYISRAINTRVGPLVLSVKVTAYFDALLPGGSSVTAYAQDGEDWVLLPVIASEEQGEGWVEYRVEAEDLEMLETRIKLTLVGTDFARPRVRKLRVAIS
jgi:hypothetical protein